MGSSVPSTVADDDLDAHVRDLLIKDAKKRAERFSQLGIRAYLSSNTWVLSISISLTKSC